MKHRAASTFIALVLIALVPAVGAAQFTTFVARPNKAVDSAKAAGVAEQTTRADSVARMSLTDMKAWVDSAAGLSSNVQVAVADTTSATPQAPAPATRPASQPEVTSFSNGAIAPATASPLPAYVTSGLLLLVIGGVLLRLRPKKA